MLRKPSNPSPYNSVVDTPTEGKSLTFTASCVSTSDIKGMRLSIKDDIYEYYLPVKNSDSCKTNSSIAIPFDADTLDEATGYYIKTSNFTRTDDGITLNNIIKPLNRYRWQVRLYQNNLDINIAYGFVQEVYTYNSSGTDAFKRRKILKVRPHTNMFMSNAKSKLNKVDDDSNSHLRNNDWNKCNQLIQYYDDNVKYQIQFNGVVYDVKDYYYSKTNAYYDTVKNKYVDLSAEKQYEEPLFAYIEIDVPNTSTTIEEGAEYTILTNYIDSNEYNFSCRELSEVTFKGRDDNPISEFANIDELDTNPDNHIYKPKFSNVQIKGAFPTTSTAKINYYKATLYQVLSNGEDIQIHDSGYVYSSEVDYDCKDLLSGNTYKLVISVTDTYGNTVSKGVYITPNCQSTVKTTLLSVTPYPKHNSVILDFGKLLSITGEESNPYDESYTISTLDAEWSDTAQKYINVNEDGVKSYSNDDDKNHIKTKVCAIAPDNSITFSKIDNTQEKLQCEKPLISMTFRCNHNSNQVIFDFTSDEYIQVLNLQNKSRYTRPRTYRLSWRNYRFVLETTGLTTKYYSPYGDMQDTWETDIHDAMKNTSKNYSVPYLGYGGISTGADETDTDGSGLRIHTESAAHDFWWQVIVSKKHWYIKCLNPPDGYVWEGGDTEWLN